MDLSISIVSYNTKALLEHCLRSLIQFTQGISYEIFVVDNASADGSAQMVREKFPQVHLIANNQNNFFAKAHNQALSKAQGRYCVILNPDLYLEENVFEPLVRFMDDHPQVACVGPKIVGSDYKVQGSGDRLPTLAYGLFEALLINTLLPKNSVRAWRRRPDWDRNQTQRVESLGGACMLVRSSIFSQVGKLDATFLLYWEETDWCKRMLDHGWQIYFYAQAQLVHYGAASSKQHSNFKRDKFFYDSMIYYYQKHFGKVVAVLFCGLLYLWTFPVLLTVRKIKSLVR